MTIERPPDPECAFCRIISGQLAATRVHEDEFVVAIDDIHPVAPVHKLLMPLAHIVSAADLVETDGPVLGRLFAVAAELAAAARLPERGYRIVSNVGREGGQTVPHLHFHLIGGRAFSWPPG
jgi:histidine triad (HIT) family protein